jgi:hypothetical protein
MPICRVWRNIAIIQSSYNKFVMYFKNTAEKLKLPILKRKWDRIKETKYILDAEKIHKRNINVIEYYKKVKNYRKTDREFNLKIGHSWYILNNKYNSGERYN